MSNNYFDFRTGSLAPFVPGSKVRAGEVNILFDAVEAAFDLLPTTPESMELGKATLATESGTGNAYVVTMPNTRTANANGDEVVFRATHANTGASTLQVDAISAVALRRFNGDPLVTGDIVSGRFYAARYDSTNTQFVIVWPAQVTTVSGAITYAAPSNTVSLAATAEGSATTVLRSDAQLTLSQAIAPTWTGAHNFTGGFSISGAAFTGFANPTGTIGLAAVNGSATTAPRSDSAPALSQAIAPTWTEQHIFGSVYSSGNAAVLLSSSLPMLEWNETDAAANNRLWQIFANSEQWTLRTSADDRVGAVSIMTVQRTGTTVDSIAFNATNITANGTEVLRTGNAFANPTGTVGLSAVNGSAVTALRSDGAPALSQSIAPTWTALHTFSKNATDINGSLLISAALPMITIRETDAAANNGYWQWFAQGEQLGLIAVNDANSASGNIMTVDRTGTTVDRVHFVPAGLSGASSFAVGLINTSSGASGQIRGTSSQCPLSVNNTSASAASLFVHNEDTTGDNTFVNFLTEGAAGTSRGSITYNRAGGLVAYNTSSDARLKAAIADAASAIAHLQSIRVRQFDWRETGNHVDWGFIAQELDEYAPWAVTKGEMWQIDRSALVPVLTKALQEALDKIGALEEKVFGSKKNKGALQ